MKEHVIINRDRTVIVPESLKKIGIQFDHNVNTITFDCPRYPDEDPSIDMSQMPIFINYMLPDKTPGSSLALNVVVDETDDTLMHFDWKITNAITPVNGVLSTLICVKQSDTEGNELYHWNTDLFQKFTVGNGMECNGQVAEMNPDVISQLLARMGEVDTRTSAEAMSGYVNEYMTENPPQPTNEQASAGVNTYMASNGQTHVDAYMTENQEMVQNSVDDYLGRNPLQLDDSLTDSTKAAPADKVGELKGDLTHYYFETINEPLFTKKDLVVNGYVLRNNGIMISEDTTSKSVYQAKLKSGETKITFGYGRCFAFYDENKTYITNEGILNESGSVTIDIPTNAVYISYSWKIETQEKFVAVYGETTEALYKIGVPTTLEKRVYNLENRTELIKADEVSFLSVGENLFNKATETQDAYLNEGEIVLDSGNAGYCVSDYIKVKANTNYIPNKNITRYCIYDKDKKYVTQNSSNQAVITPTVDGYIRLAYYSPSADKHNSNELMFIIGDTVPTEYKAYCFYPNSTVEYPLDFNKTWWKDKLICTFGDSNTANARWQDFMCNKLKCTYQNCGIGGSSMAGTDEHAMWTDFRINQISEKTNAILIMAGTNDGASSREVGVMSLDNTDTNTFVGAYNTCIRKIYTKMGNTFPIFLFTPIPCFSSSYPRVKQMAQAVREIGAMWSLPVIDAQNECGINVANWESLYASDGVHVDYEGGKMLASLVVGILKAHEPID